VEQERITMLYYWIISAGFETRGQMKAERFRATVKFGFLTTFQYRQKRYL